MILNFLLTGPRLILSTWCSTDICLCPWSNITFCACLLFLVPVRILRVGEERHQQRGTLKISPNCSAGALQNLLLPRSRCFVTMRHFTVSDPPYYQNKKSMLHFWLIKLKVNSLKKNLSLSHSRVPRKHIRHWGELALPADLPLFHSLSELFPLYWKRSQEENR